MSINRKFTIWIISVVSVLGLLSSYIYYRFEMDEEIKRLDSLGNTVGALLEQSLDNYMLTKDYNVLNKTLHNIAGIESIGKILLINREGVVKGGTDKELMGKKLSFDDPRCKRCHEKGRRGHIFRDEKIFRWVQPISNKPECYKCHSPSIKYNGIFCIDFSLSESEKHVKKDILRGFSIFIPSIIIIGFVVIFLSNRLVIKKLSIMADKIRKFKEGDYRTRLIVESDDEISRLEENFNEMAEAINIREEEKEELFMGLQAALDRVSRSQKQWQETFDSITDLVSIHDKDFKIVRANKAFEKFFGIPIKDIINRKCHEVFHCADTPLLACPHTRSLKELQPSFEEVVDHRINKTFAVSTFPFHSPEGELIGTVHIARDVTEEKEKEMRLIMNERLASLGQMASGIAHELNNPLASIAGCAERLGKKVKGDKYDSELFGNYLGMITEEVLRCKNITTNMLSFVRKTTEKKTVDINHILEKTLEIIGFQGRLEGINLIRNYADGLFPVKCDEGTLRQAVLAIITNALDAMHDDGTLTIETGVEQKDKVYIKIGDTGPGIPGEIIGNIFDPFFTTKSDSGGTGLGLSIAKRIILDLQGDIDVASEEDKGAMFKIILPIIVQ